MPKPSANPDATYIEAGPDHPKPEAAEGQHPDPEGKMTSYAPGYGPEGALPKEESTPKAG